ncbi:Asp23/Gls24 family envelope stress response protein [Nocardia sp. alder85J]|uniref:Asp23/Gls24 family envelope stress response protein n=1 Tax=Nocardia sp. alder85J TaxID=2862949 RepID=UPI001CD33840|nr:Asp23/Gls24 family envelope stress response protein [Nocardia sp. alder85J]MCX4093581.1 Asp23/Gls24 family envelope stress response protein [Nocardia sp. alder85J]
MTTAVVAGEDPGITTVAPRAVRRIVAQLAREVPGVGAAVRVAAEIVGDRTTLDVELPIRYPAPVNRVSEACREQLVRRTRELTGLAVTGIDIVVTELSADTTTARRVR